MTITATVEKIKSAEQMGEYKRTSLDYRKDAADFLLVQVGPYMIRWNDGRIEKVNERQLRKLQSNHTWATDF